MNSVSAPQTLVLPLNLTEVNNQPVLVDFDGGQISSDAGLLLLREVEQQIGIINSLADVIHDPRDARYIKHTIMDLMMQRVSQIAAGYGDADDCDEFRCDPIIKMCAGRSPETDDDLASQPTMGRFENSIIIFRGDSHFSYPEVMEWIDGQENVYFNTGLTANPRLEALVQSHIERAKKLYNFHKNEVSLYHSFYYKADSWNRYQRVIAKIEILEDGVLNVRYIVTDMVKAKAKTLYRDIYCARGNAELYIKEHKLYLKSDRIPLCGIIALLPINFAYFYTQQLT